MYYKIYMELAAQKKKLILAAEKPKQGTLDKHFTVGQEFLKQ